MTTPDEPVIEKNEGNEPEVVEDAVAQDTSTPERVRRELDEKRLSAHRFAMSELVDRSGLAAKLFPNHHLTVEGIEAKYPPRQVKEGAMVTRVAPSPTGFMHIGGIYVALISERLAHQTEGVFYLRIEDTDRKREIEGAADLIVNSMGKYGIKIDEGQTSPEGAELGAYGPYKQSERKDIYTAYVKSLIESGKAYPCFCSSEDLDAMRASQETKKVRPGYYGQSAKCRNKSEEEIAAEMESGKSFVIRFKSQGDFENKVSLNDQLKGPRLLSQNDQDAVILKSDGLPTYHFAHVVDDHLMQTTHVIRGDEWVSSTSLHLELFQALGWKIPEYGHIMPIQKMDGTSKRKLSKRKDPEASVTFYDEQGYPENAVIEYLLNLANSNFEDWRKQNSGKDNRDFKLTLERLAHSSGALFDFKKLNDVSRDIIARYSAAEVYAMVHDWAQKNSPEFADIIAQDPDYARNIFNIDRGDVKARKDITKWSDVEKEVGYFFDAKFQLTPEEAATLLQGIGSTDIKAIVADFVEISDTIRTKDECIEKIREIGLRHGYAESTKTYKENQTAYKGHIADVTKIFRVLLSGRTQTPHLYSIMQVMGKGRVAQRLSIAEKLT